MTDKGVLMLADWVKATALALALLVPPAVAWGAPTPVTIDDFGGSSLTLVVWGEPGHDSASAWQNVGSSAIGGRRDTKLTWTSGDGNSSVAINRRSSHHFAFAEDPSTAAKAELTYGMGGDLEADFTGAGHDRFRLDFTFADRAATVRIVVTTTGWGASSATISTPFDLLGGSVSKEALFSSFQPLSGTGARFNDVDVIQVAFHGVDGGDYIVSGIYAVPEPATLTLVALGLGGLLHRRKRGAYPAGEGGDVAPGGVVPGA